MKFFDENLKFKIWTVVWYEVYLYYSYTHVMMLCHNIINFSIYYGIAYDRIYLVSIQKCFNCFGIMKCMLIHALYEHME